MPPVPKSCLITGATRGLGYALTTAFWQSGWNVFLVARSEAALQHTAATLEPRPYQTVHTITADLVDPNSTFQVIDAVKSISSTLDVLINNAAIQGPIGPTWESDWTDWANIMNVNLLSPVALCRAAASFMIATRTKGSIINLSGGGATRARPYFSAYATAKAGLVRFSETLAQELRLHNIRVNCIAPGPMPTGMLEEIVAKGAEGAGEKEYNSALNALHMPTTQNSMQKAIDLALFLASDRSRGITGKLISALWDHWEQWPYHLEALNSSDVYTLGRITGQDRHLAWGDK